MNTRNNPGQNVHSEQLLSSLRDRFEHRFDRSFDGTVYFCPGRVNLIGEHIDYSGGHVLPVALNLGIYALVNRTDDDCLRFQSTDFSSQLQLPAGGSANRVTDPGDWGAYPEGVVRELSDTDPSGCDVLFHSTLPVGSGLSSSAALEVLTAYLLLDQSDQRLDRADIARLCHRVENEFIGVDCGIMDQFAVALGRQDHALLLNCQSEEYTHVPFSLDDHRLVIMNTNKQRELSDSAYNQRRKTCDKALRQLREDAELDHLCEASPDLVNEVLTNDLLHRRARHTVTEERRVIDATACLENQKFRELGHLMNESHDSLRDDYEVTGRELDAIVDAARDRDECVGARMTGAGFGGCAIALVRNPHLPSFTDHVEEEYEEATGISPDFYDTTANEGVHKLETP